MMHSMVSCRALFAMLLAVLFIFSRRAALPAAAGEAGAGDTDLPAAAGEAGAGDTDLPAAAGQAGVEDTDLPARYDCRDAGKDPTVRRQGRNGTCWAISACSALEGVLLPERRLVFSPDHLSLNNGFILPEDQGGDYHMIMAYLTAWEGPVLESEDPYGDGETVSGLEPSVHVQQIRLLEGEDRDSFKRLILEYGPVQTSIRMDRKMTASSAGYYSKENIAYYCPEEGSVTHDIILLGWDDGFSRDKFAQTPPGDGAWICQNPWGTTFGDGGIFYVSYYDALVASSGLAYTGVEDTDNYDHIYQQDVCGWQGRIGYDSGEAYFANIYRAGSAQMLEGFGFYCIGSGTEYELFVIHDFKGDGSLNRRKKIGEGKLEGAGYVTVAPDQRELLEEGERFGVAVHVISPDAGKPVAVEMKKDDTTAKVTLRGKEGYLSGDGIVWSETQEVYGVNICLKAYTSDAGTDAETEE